MPKNRKQTLTAKVNQWVRQYGVQVMKNYPAQPQHPQMWRNNYSGGNLTGPGARLGPYGELGDSIIFSMDLVRPYLLKPFGFSEMFLRTKFKSDVLFPLLQFMRDKINRWVPMMSGKLRESLFQSLTNAGGSHINKFPFILLLNTEGVPYAGPVNQMPNKWLRHPSPTHPNRRHGYILNDPNATKGWFNLLLLNGRKKAKQFIQAYLRDLGRSIPAAILQFYGVTGYAIVRSLFNVRYS